MKKIILVLVLILISNISFAQITTTKAVEKKVEYIKYDSLQNFLGKDVYKYVGQDLYLKGVSESLRKYGYGGFSLDYTKSTLKRIIMENLRSVI